MAEDVPRYDELKLRIERADDHYSVVAFGPQGSTAREAFSLPLSSTELDNFILRVGRPRRGVRSYRSSRMEEAKRFGAQLFDAVVCGDVRDVYREARGIAEDHRRGLRVTLYLTDTPELMDVPWEFLYERPRFLSQSIYSPVVRSLDLKSARPPHPVTLPLRILGMVSRPEGVETLDIEQEQQKLTHALTPLRDRGLVALDWLERATLGQLDEAISRRQEVHVLHYIGHGAYDERTQGGILVLETDRGMPKEVTGEELGSVLQDEHSLQLVVLNSCEGARSSHVDPFSGVASSLVECGIPAVIGMQFEITDEGAITFAARFYAALAEEYPVDAALAQARKAIFAAGNDIEFATPVLFLRAADARLFNLERTAPSQAPTGSREAECDFALHLEQRPHNAKPGEQITWQLGITNTGSCTLRELTARNAAGEVLSDPVELEPGRRHTVRWRALLEPDLRELITISARDPQGSSISEQLTATATAVAEPKQQPLRAPERPASDWRASAREVLRLEPAGAWGVAFSPDGGRIATASDDKTARVWDADGGHELTRVTHDDSVRGVAFSPDGRRVATASADITARVWDAVSGVELTRVAHDGWVRGVAFSPDGFRIATASQDMTARVWDAVSGHELTRVTRNAWIIGVAFSPDGARIATASADITARVWDAESGLELTRVTHDAWIIGVAFSPDGGRIATASDDKTARVWDADSGYELTRVTHDDWVRGVAFSPDGCRIATASADRTARVWDGRP